MNKAKSIGLLAGALVGCILMTATAEEPVADAGDDVAVGWGALMKRGAGAEAPAEKPATRQLSVDELIEKFDANGNGKLDGDEILKARSEAKRRRMAQARERVGQGRGNQEKPWQDFDADGNGKLDRAEAVKMRETIKQRKEAKAAEAGAGQKMGAGGQAKPQDMQEMVRQFDADGDGRLNQQEMMQARQKMIMRKCDLDGDGQLNQQEMMQARQMMKRYAGADCPEGNCPMGGTGQGPHGRQAGGQGGGQGRGMGPQGGAGGGRGGGRGGAMGGGGGRGGR
jgi:Ca2+-binding EF-hand superfamily protein